MEKKKQKSKFNMKKVGKFFKNVGQKIIDFFKSLYEQFMSLPKKVRQIIYVWLIVVIVVLIIVIASTNNKKFLETYAKIETEINNSTLDYIKENELFPTKDSKLKLDLDVLLEYGYFYDDIIEGKTCKGFSISYYDDQKQDYVVSSYINCDKYTTKGYSDYK